MTSPQKNLNASELIITERGAIYHLNLKPEQLADTIILVGDPARVVVVSKHFDKTEHKTQHREFITHTGYIGNKRISVISTGIGTDNIDIVMNELDALANIDFKTRNVKSQTKNLRIIRLGTCGALQADTTIDSLIVSSYAIGLDNLMHYYKHENNADEQYILHEFGLHTRLQNNNISPYIAEASIQLRKYFGNNFLHGITVTTPGFYAPQARAMRIPIALPNLLDAMATFNSRNMRILNFEMETSALYGLGKVMQHHCLSVSTVINNRQLKKISANIDAAIDNMITKTLEAIA
ncbi:MAG: nucleoside phosphorylase [Flavipsychrobacter sp.]|nr:nucleoside phosphorylase [Flavipsychrobacter sp.]